jgi:hypothetical protein
VGGGFPVIEAMQLDKNNLIQNTQAIQESQTKKSFIDKIVEFIVPGKKVDPSKLTNTG